MRRSPRTACPAIRLRGRARPILRPTLALAAIVVAAIACDGSPPPEEWAVQGPARPRAIEAATQASQAAGVAALERAGSGAREAPSKQILFGDLHVHTTFSQDAFLFALPAFGGDGAHPPADACDFARYCANLDFFALTDHAESLRPEHWEVSKQSLRECATRAGDPASPDLVPFMGFEWTNAGLTPEEHYGHRCVIFPGLDDASLPARPIASADKRPAYLRTAETMARLRWLDPLHWDLYRDYEAYGRALDAFPACEEGVSSAELPAGCFEVAATPADLHRKLDEAGLEALDIPHGTAWGVYTPATTTIDKHLAAEQYDADRMRLIEIASGHGNSESWAGFREWELGEDGERVCPAPTEDYLPCCWQAGEIMRSRCDGLEPAECERRVELAREYATEAYTRVNRVFPDAAPEEWLDCGQCRDCFKPSFDYRPLESVQYGMSLSNEAVRDESGRPLRFRYGFVGSSDEHSGRPGVGYKNVDRRLMTDVNDAPEGLRALWLGGRAPKPDPQMPQRPGRDDIGTGGNDGRTQSFLYPGALAAAHARSRSREDVWDAFQRREVYATSGPRILLWFDLLNAPGGGRQPMGSEVGMREAPAFEVRAIGSFEPRPGCPDWSREGLGEERVAALCRNECHFPSEIRRPIVAIEVVRITPRIAPDEPVAPRIEDPWRRFECDDTGEGCVVRFEDETFAERGRDVLYYVRALEEARPAILGDPLRPRRGADGRVASVEICPSDDDCLDPVEERAWSSPIFVDFARDDERDGGGGDDRLARLERD